jgi:hypothetical protein
MKKILFLFPIIALIFSSCDIPTTDSAIKYNDEMLAIQTEIDNQMADFIDNYEFYSRSEAEELIEEMSNNIDDAIETVKSKNDFDGKDDFKKAMIKLLEDYKDLLHKEFYLLFVEFDTESLVTDEDYEMYEIIYYDFLEKYDNAHYEFTEFQQGFADKWNFTVGE